MAQRTTGLARRTLASGAMLALTSLTGGAVPLPSVDAQLIAMGIEGRRIGEEHRRETARWSRMAADDLGAASLAAALDASYDRMWELYEQAITIKAVTPEGWQAKAELARHFLSVECENKEGRMVFASSEQELVWSLVCDLTGRAAV